MHALSHKTRGEEVAIWLVDYAIRLCVELQIRAGTMYYITSIIGATHGFQRFQTSGNHMRSINVRNICSRGAAPEDIFKLFLRSIDNMTNKNNLASVCVLVGIPSL